MSQASANLRFRMPGVYTTDYFSILCPVLYYDIVFVGPQAFNATL